MSALLEASHIVRIFGHGDQALTAVNDVSCSLEAGRTLGIVGESGSGKSTLGEIMGGLQEPTEGRVLFEGTDVRTLDRAGRTAYHRAVQFVFQDALSSMDPSYTVEKVITEPLVLLERGTSRAQRHERAVFLLSRVGLEPDVLPVRPAELSGGQCQRIAIARALICGPAVVVCDECTSALDVSVQAQILNLLRDLQDELGTAYLFISHDIGVVGYIADDVLVMHKGVVVERGCASEVLAHPHDAYTQALLDAAQRE